jgi:hypothetical protein
MSSETANDLLTEEEFDLIDDLADVYDGFEAIVGPGPTRATDLAEVRSIIHGLQEKVMAQAAARAYPDEFRLLGDVDL